MFLAINELLKEKSRFILITLIIVLVSYLTFFLTALAYGLATSYTQGIDSWDARGIVLQKDVNDVIGRSLLFRSQYEPLESDNTALLGVGSATVQKDTPEDVALFGVEMSGFLKPVISGGRGIEAEYDVVASEELQEIGVTLGDELKFSGSDTAYKVVGFTEGATFQTAPIIYMQLATWRSAASDIAGMIGMRDDTTISAVVTKDLNTNNQYDTPETSWQSIRDFSFTLPGYQAQVLTFSIMIGFLIIIASFVLAIFMYILTLQKKSIFGVLKAEGVPSSYIGWSVIVQVLVLLAVGLSIGLILALASGWLLGTKVPFMVNALFYGVIILLFVICAGVGAIASVRSVTKIDPVEAIG